MQNQHFVPQLLLKKFVDRDGRLFFLDKRTDQFGKIAPKRAASKAGFYEFSVDGMELSLEERFQKHEAKAGKALQKLASGASPLKLSVDERDDLAAFIALQSFRTEAFLANLQGQETRADQGKVLARLWDSLFLVAPLIACRHWMVMQIVNDEVFYLGDNPVVLQNTEAPSSQGALGFDVVGVEAFLPITPKLALYLPCRSISDQIITAHRDGIVMQKELWARGRGMTVEAITVGKALRGTRVLHDAAVLGTPVVAGPESILNLNYLQCSWAHRHIFSNRADFETAKMIFEKTPQYRGSPKSSFASIFSS